MQHTSTHITKLCVHSTPIGLDTNISPILSAILDLYAMSTPGKWAHSHAHKVYTELGDAHEDLGILVKIMVDFNHEDAVAYKLMFDSI